MISLVDAPVCVTSGFPIATGKHIRDCDLVPSTSASCTPALEADEVRSTTSIYRAIVGAGSALSVSFVLFVHKKWHRNHRDTRTLEHYRTLSLTISVTPRETLYTQREAARTKKSQKSRRNVNEENVHQMELLKVPEIIFRGGELVARGPSAREHQPAARIEGETG